MVDVTVGQLAKTLKQEPDHLLKLMRQAGLPHETDDEIVSDQQKMRFLTFVQNRQNAASTAEQQRKITIRRKDVSTLRTGKGGRGAAVEVERRRKKVFVRRTAPPPAPTSASAPAAPSQTDLEAERIRREDVQRQEARQQEEARRQAEEEARQEATRKAEEEQARAEAEARTKEEAPAETSAEADAGVREAAKDEAQAATEQAATEQAATERGERTAAPARGKPEGRGPARTPRRGQSPDALARAAAAEAAEKAEIAARAAESGNRRAPGRAGGRHRGREGDRGREGVRGREADHGRGRRRELSMKQESRRAKRRHLTVEKQGGEFERPSEVMVREVEIGDFATVGELAQGMSVKAGEVIKTLMGMGVMATINQALDQDTAVLVVEELGHKVKLVAEDEVEQVLEQSLQVEGERQSRPPVVTVMGHVDHGKTSLLDHIRNTRVVAGEAGGITQHIGAYHVETEHGNITFIDTPGHAAFTAMRARGAKSTDVVILVVAADDGVMPQTEEAVNHARAAEVPIVVAVNKIDLESADPERARNELGALNVIPEEWGGDTQFVDVSAETGQGIDALLEAVILQSELLELDAVPAAPGQGVVIESRLDRGRGPVATLLVQNGTLKRGDVVIAGQCVGRVRAMHNERGETVEVAPPSIPVEMLGLNGTPDAGDEFSAVAGERQAREVAEFRAGRSQAQRHASQKAATLESMFAHLGQGDKRVLKLIIKADVRGSLEAIMQACADIGDDEVSVNILGSGVGGITESDANMALTYGAAIFGFNTRADNAAKAIIERESMDLRYYSVIYELLDDIKSVLEGMLAPEVREEIVGMAEVRDVFRSPRFGQVAGCMVVEGVVARNRKIRVLRDNVVIFEGELESLRRFKDDVNEVRNGLECGIGVRNYNDVRAGDKIEVFESREIARTLNDPARAESAVREQAV